MFGEMATLGPVTTAPAAPPWLAGLNDEQRAAVDHDAGPLLILAGAGTGKTTTLVARLARLLATGVAPERILLVTFSRRAADELVRRVGAMTDQASARRLTAGTFHAVAHGILHRHATALGLAGGFSVIDPGDATELIGMVRADLPAASDTRTRRTPRAATMLAVYSRVVNSGTAVDAVVAADFPWCGRDVDDLRAVFRAYTARKRAGGLLDFDDLLLAWRAAVGDPVIGPVLAGSWDHVLVDEYQDTNTVQSDILRGLCRAGGLTVVGDDAQAIYGFRAATVRNLIDFPTHHPGAAQVTLERNYRSTQPILDLANAVAAGLAEGTTKALWSPERSGSRPLLATCPDEGAQADAVCEMVLDLRERGVALRDQAVLFRSGHHSDLLELECGRRHIPFVKFGGLRFLDTAHVRDLVALLRILDNPWDELAWHRVLLLGDGIGPATARRLLGELGVRPRDGAGADDPVGRFVAGDAPGLRRGGPALAGLALAVGDCRHADLSPQAEVERLVEAIGPIVRARYERPDARIADLRQLAEIAAGSGTRRRFVTDLTLNPPASTGDLAGRPSLDDDYLVLSTVHSAKGGEWQAVHVIHAADGMFPSDLATGTAEGVDEERRLFYVALTRARRHLHVYVPLRYHHGSAHRHGDRHGTAQRTRFLPPTIDHLLDVRPVRVAASSTGATAGDPAGTGRPVDVTAAIDAGLDGLW